jgi:hypothetical protein
MLHLCQAFYPGSIIHPATARLCSYLYDVRHHYGLEGKRVACAPFACHDLGARPPRGSDPGGCPFASLAPHAVAAALVASGVAPSDAAAFSVAPSAGSSATARCRAHFAVSHPRAPPLLALTHPHQWTAAAIAAARNGDGAPRHADAGAVCADSGVALDLAPPDAYDLA